MSNSAGGAFSCKSLHGTFHFDLSQELNQDGWDKYEVEQHSTLHTVQLDDLKCNIEFYPKGDGTYNARMPCLRVRVVDPRIDDDRMLKVMLTVCGNDLGVDYPVDKPGVSASVELVDNLQDELQALKDDPIVVIKLGLEKGDVYNTQKSKRAAAIAKAFSEKKKFYELGKKHGDVVLKLDTEETTNNEELLEPPPSKKRRLNHNSAKEDKKEDEDLNSEEMKACSIMLRAASPVFDKFYVNDTMERKSNTICIAAESIDDIDDLWFCICTGQLKEDCNIENLIGLAHLYDVRRVFEKCVDHLLRNLDVNSLLETVRIFNKYEIEDGCGALLKYAKDNYEELEKKGDFAEFPHWFKQSVQLLKQTDKKE